MSSIANISALRRIVNSPSIEPYIRHIRFPFYKNLAPGTRIDFTFPITALVGANGTNKSSVLRAIQGAPGYENLGNYWFSTKVDPIEEAEADKNCFIYGYNHSGAKSLVEVLKTRTQKKDDPDYWEPSRAIIKYDMSRYAAVTGNRAKTRYDTISKKVVYIDFRQSLSAFDKFFYKTERESGASIKQRKSVIRRRSVHLQSAIENHVDNYLYQGKERIVDGENRSLTADEVKIISNILGRKYSGIEWIRHDFFNNDAYTCILKSDELTYTEAFAGSGEFAVVRLVVEILKAEAKSLILLDEPEVSLHPGAQEKLMEFLFEQTKKHKHQVIISTHSPSIIRRLPSDAIKVFVYDAAIHKIKLPSQNSEPEEAFFYLGEPLKGKVTIIVEDGLAAGLVRKALRLGGEAYQNRFEVKHLPGGAEAIWSQYVTTFALEKRNDVIVLFDGDKRPSADIVDPNLIPITDESKVLTDKIKSATGVDIKFIVNASRSSQDDGSAQRIEAQTIFAQRNFLDWARKHVRFLPGAANPEGFIWDNMKVDEISNSVSLGAAVKLRFEELTRREMGLSSYETLSSGDILQTQLRRLASISDENADIMKIKSTIDAIIEQKKGQ